MTSPTQELQPALDIDAGLTEIERGLNLLLNVTPVNAAEAWADFERGDFGTVPTLRLRPLGFEPDLVRRDLYNLQIEDRYGPIGATPKELWSIIIALVVLVGVAVLLQRTRMGKAMRAVADNPDLSLIHI